MERIETFLNKLEKFDRNLIRIVCPFFNYEKSSIFQLIFDTNSNLVIVLLCHNHILLIKSYFNCLFDNLSIKKEDLCEYDHTKKSKSISFCFQCSCYICQNCSSSIHTSHIKNNYSDLIIKQDVIEKEYNNNSKNILKIIEYTRNNLDKLNRKKINALETIFLIYIIEKIVYIEYIQESKNDNFSYACLKNINYIREISSKICLENILNMEEYEILFCLVAINWKIIFFNN